MGTIDEKLKEYEGLPEELSLIEGEWPEGYSMKVNLNAIRPIKYGMTYFPKSEFMARTYDNEIITETYAEWFDHVVRIGNALKELGIPRHSFIQVLSDNILEANEAKVAIWFADCIPEYANPAFDLKFIAHGTNLFKDQAVFVGVGRLQQVEAIADQLKTVKHFIIMPEIPKGGTKLKSAYSYKDLLKKSSPKIERWPDPPDNSLASVNWTTGTTGIPKPCLHNHRDVFLHIMGQSFRSNIGIGLGDSILHVIGVYHAGHWSKDLTGMMWGCRQVLVGAAPDAEWMAKLVEMGRVTYSAGVPQVWERFLNYVDDEEKRGHKIDISSLKRINLAGTAPSLALQKRLEERGIEPLHGWGMSEGPCWGAVMPLQKPYIYLSPDERRKLRKKQGIPLPGLIEMKVIDELGRDVPRDGESVGEICERGPMIISRYYKRPEETEKFFTKDGWFNTGDLGVVDHEGYVEIVDRSKDLIKSGGEWISSIRIENEAAAHPKVAQCACASIPHPDWTERPILLVVPKSGEEITEEEILKFLAPKFPNWYLPDKVFIVDDVPKTSVGKINKSAIRDQYKDYRLPEEPIRKKEDIKKLSGKV